MILPLLQLTAMSLIIIDDVFPSIMITDCVRQSSVLSLVSLPEQYYKGTADIGCKMFGALCARIKTPTPIGTYCHI